MGVMTPSSSAAVIRGDLHVHSSHSACDHPAGAMFGLENACGRRAIEEMTLLARRGGMEYFALVNHASDPTHPHQADRVTNEKILHHLNEVLLVNARLPLRSATVLAGVEASLLPDGTLDVDNAILSHLDLVIVSRHGGPRQLPQRITHAFLRAMDNPHVDIIGHPTRFLGDLSLRQWEGIVRKARATQTAIEFNLRVPFDPALARLVADERVMVALGSDTHRETRGEKVVVSKRNAHARRLVRSLLASGVKAGQILNLQPFAAVQRWLQRRR